LCPYIHRNDLIRKKRYASSAVSVASKGRMFQSVIDVTGIGLSGQILNKQKNNPFVLSISSTYHPARNKCTPLTELNHVCIQN
jgi:hypothetical protein